MIVRSRACVAGSLIVLAFLEGGFSLARRADSEEDLLARIQRESNPVKKARYEIRLGRTKLFRAIDAFNQGRVDQCHQMIGSYVEHMKSSWETLRRSGRRAARQPSGFKELDIALREDQRFLDDLKRRMPYDDRDPVEKAAREVEQIRNEVLRALFP